jgi:capsular polysaccharide biosynthesis protein
MNTATALWSSRRSWRYLARTGVGRAARRRGRRLWYVVGLVRARLRPGPVEASPTTLAGLSTDAAAGVVLEPAADAEEIHRHRPLGPGGGHEVFTENLHRTAPAARNAVLTNGTLIGEYGAVVTETGGLLTDYSESHHEYQLGLPHRLLRQSLPGGRTDIDGTVGSIACDGASMYYHWLFHSLVRLDDLERHEARHGIRLDRVAVSSRRLRFQSESLDALGLEPQRVIALDETPAVRARTLVVPAPVTGDITRRSVEFLRSRIGAPPTEGSPRRIYVSRGAASSRRLLNEAAILPLLEDRGFTTVRLEELAFVNQVALFAGAEAVVGAHGSGLSNVVFGTDLRLVELFSPRLIGCYFWRICDLLGFPYHAVIGTNALGRTPPHNWDASADLVVDPETLARTLDLAGIR